MQANDEAIQLNLHQLRRRLLHQGDMDGLILAKQQLDVKFLRSHYLLRIMNVLNGLGTAVGRDHCSCQNPGCSAEVTTAIGMGAKR